MNDKFSEDAMAQAIEMLAYELDDSEVREIADYAEENNMTIGEAFHAIVEIGFDLMDREQLLHS